MYTPEERCIPIFLSFYCWGRDRIALSISVSLALTLPTTANKSILEVYSVYLANKTKLSIPCTLKGQSTILGILCILYTQSVLSIHGWQENYTWRFQFLARCAQPPLFLCLSFSSGIVHNFLWCNWATIVHYTMYLC